jgi:ribose 5-phosphate isomerase B
MQTSVIYLASDHAGCVLKGLVCEHLEASSYRVIDLGPGRDESVDYPDFGIKLAMALRDDIQAYGIAVCGSGIGISIAVNRFPWVRAALVSSPEAASLSRQHNNANVLALGERLIAPDLALACVDKFFATQFEGGRHQSRVEKLSTIEVDGRYIR